MRRHAGVTTGDVIGKIVEAAGTDGIAAMPRGLPRCLRTSGSIQGIGIPAKWSGSMSFTSRITVTSRGTP